MLGLLAYLGMRGSLAAFIIDLVIISLRFLIMLFTRDRFLIAVFEFFGYWANVGVTRTAQPRRGKALNEQFKRVLPPDPIEPPPPPWIPPRLETWPPH